MGQTDGRIALFQNVPLGGGIITQETARVVLPVYGECDEGEDAGDDDDALRVGGQLARRFSQCPLIVLPIYDRGTIRVPPFVSTRTIRIRDEGR